MITKFYNQVSLLSLAFLDVAIYENSQDLVQNWQNFGRLNKGNWYERKIDVFQVQAL